MNKGLGARLLFIGGLSALIVLISWLNSLG